MIDYGPTQELDVILTDEYFESVKRAALVKADEDERTPAAQRSRRTRLLLEKFRAATR